MASFSPPQLVRWYLHDCGWKRGSIIELDGNEKLIASLPLEHQLKIRCMGYAILITVYDCALIHESFIAEPDVGYALIKKIEAIDNALANAKNERVLNFTASAGTISSNFEVTTGELGFFDRSLLLNAKRSTQFETSKPEQLVVGKWISRRSTQPTYPDNFNNRVNRNKKDDLFKKSSDTVAAFYIRISPADKELSSNENYNVSIIAAIEDSKMRQARKDKLDVTLHDRVKKALPSKNGLIIDSFDMMPESEITLGMLRNYVQWADEYFSFRNNPYSSLPVNIN
ncbi:hypothetical protein V9R59_002750 [Vibrio harveyi]|uniref:hypothetical protein n=1 Tax=Vibrio harveyi TaxID=669 RepID=UPI003CE9D14D|nr:hypothetical protein [Vibrio harveyi]